MQVARKKTRKFLFQKLYARLFGEVDAPRFQGAFFDDIFEYKLDEKYFTDMYKLILENQNYFLHILNTYAPKFDIEKMNKVNILTVCLGICEMKFLGEEIPAKVSLNEAVEIAKAYGDDSSPKIVNGVLNSYYKNFDKHTDTKQIPEYKIRIFT